MVEEGNKFNEPEAIYDATSSKKKITFFNSFDEAEEYKLRQMAKHSHEERLSNLEVIRKRTYMRPLLSNGKLPSLERVIIIVKG